MEKVVTALIMAAGRGSRVGGDIPKQYQVLHGTMLLRYAINAFIEHSLVQNIQVVIHKDDIDLYHQATQGLDILPPVMGGELRQDSVRLGLAAIGTYASDYVLIHDAARPFVSQRIISDVIQGLHTYSAVMPVLGVADTLKKVDQDGLLVTVDRSQYVRAQTPQGFDYSMICSYHQLSENDVYTDDIALCEMHGVKVGLVDGAQLNGKITTQEDIIQMTNMTQPLFKTRVGMGFDVHRFSDDVDEGDIMLCGVPVPHDHSLVAHSDGDVGLHAIVDALLGTIAAGDIGMHFPPSDPQWKDKDSSAFVVHALDLVKEKGGCIDHVDITLICERPKVRSYVDSMRECVGELLGLEIDNVSVKATTTEKLGFTGRKEGIAAQAVVSVTFPVKGGSYVA